MAAKSSNLPLIAFAAAAVAVVGGVLYFAGVFSPSSPSGPGEEPVRRVSMTEILAPGSLPDMALGEEGAPVTIVEYASLTCVHCGNFHKNTWPELKEKYIDTGKVRFIFREYPLDNIATAGFMLARCANPDSYFAIIGAFFQHQESLFALQSNEQVMPWLTDFARQVGFTQESMNACLTNQELQSAIAEVKQQGDRLGVSSTPTFFINGGVYPGDMRPAELERRLQPLLAN